MPRDIKTRLGGVVALVIGAICLYSFLWLPLQAAYRGEPEINYQLRVFALVPLCIVFGLAFLIGGDKFEYRTADHKNLTASGWMLFGAVVVMTGLGWWWFDQQFTALGYI